MPPRNEQDFEVRRQQIIDGALQVFASKGFEKATNKEIAAVSGIGSPGLIYHYFKDKSDLFRQVFEQRLPLLQLLKHSDNIMTKPSGDVLTIFGNAFLRILNNSTSVALFKLILSEVHRQPQTAELLNKVQPSRSFTFLTRYLAQQMEIGVLKPMHPGAAAHCFVGSLLFYTYSHEIFPQPDTQQINPEIMVATAVEVFLQGMQISLTDSV